MERLNTFYSLKTTFEKCHLPYDSVYGKLLLKIGIYEIQENRNYSSGFQYLNYSVRINTFSKRDRSKYLATKAYYALAYYYADLGLIEKALGYYDSTITVATYTGETYYILVSKLYKTNIYFHCGDYQKAIEESTSGINLALREKDTTKYIQLLTQRAQAYFFQGNHAKAIADNNAIILIAKDQKKTYELASALKLNAMVFAKNKNYNDAIKFFNDAVITRKKTDKFHQIALDYIDYGNFLLNELHDYKNSKQRYIQASKYAKKIGDSAVLALSTMNIGAISIFQKNYEQSAQLITNTLQYLNLSDRSDFLKTPSANQLYLVSNKELVMVLTINKIETLLGLYSRTTDKKYLSSCIQTALTTDSLITKIRNFQTGTESKLYWRDFTRDFYINSLKACFEDKNANKAFYFMEKSRAVLLNDKLSEIDACSYLSSTDAARQENYKIKIIELEQQLAALSENSKQYRALELKLINTKNASEQFIKSLEQKYPAYYQYKYDDKVPELKDMQSFLAKNNQSFVHYFTGDTSTYILGITPTQTKFIRLSQKEFDKNKLSQFLQFCANKQALNNDYSSFVTLSHSIYASLFEQLQLPKGRVVICMDNTIIPFEALCTDAKGKNFLLNDHSFDYAYSARLLMKEFKNSSAKGNFAGFAPVSFAKHLGVVDLKNAATALNTSASYYGNDKLFTHKNASRDNFFNYASSFSVVSIFSHAYADTTDSEPVLFMCDSLIHLSELQKLNDPATKLVLLSACQTNVGKNATGEGIYSLARGFATAGIPSVAATLWKADEQMIYAISEKLNEYLAEGMNKDEALQKAKLYFVQNSSSEKLLPYYWANMILIGNADAIKFKKAHHYNYLWWAGMCVIATASAIMFIKRRKR